MLKYFAKAFKITNENIILATPLVLFLFLFSVYMGIAQNAPETPASAILLASTIIFMLSAFFAGWFYMVKKAIELDKQEFIIEEDKAKASFNLIKELPAGVGEYFLTFIGAFLLYITLFGLVFYSAYHLGLHFIGKVDLNINELRMAFGSTEGLKTLASSLSTEQLIKLNQWNLLILGIVTVYSFITMFWAAEITAGNKNPLSAFLRSVKFTFRKFLGALILFIYISFVNFTVSLINAISMANPIIYFISMLVYFYFFVYVIVLIFLYYDRENQPKYDYTITDESYKSEQDSCTEDSCTEDNCTKDNSDSGADSIGQDETGDSESKRD